MAEPVRVRSLTDKEGQKLKQTVRRGSTSSVRYRRAMMLLASAGESRVPVIAQLVQADEDTVRDVIHRFNAIGLACLDPQWAGGRPRLLTPDDEDFAIRTATCRPTRQRPDLHHPGQPLRPHRRRHPPMGEEEQGRAELHPDLRILGQPDRGPLRPAAAVHPGQLPPPQPPHANPGLHRYLRWRNANARHPNVLAAQRKERARIRSEKGIRWGGRPLNAAA